MDLNALPTYGDVVQYIRLYVRTYVAFTLHTYVRSHMHVCISN